MKRTPGLVMMLVLFGVPSLFAQGSAPSRVVNLSTRARVSTTSPLVTGFAIAGTTARPVLVRAAGPSLAAFGVDGAVAAPRLEVRDAGGNVVLTNSGWADSAALANSFAQAGAFPFGRGSADAAVVATLNSGSYTVQVSDSSGAGGVALAEIYDLGGAATDSRLVNVSTLATIGAEGSELISGFVIDGGAARDFLLRGVGPGLSQHGVTGALGDPMITLFDARGTRVAGNDNWSGTLAEVRVNLLPATTAAAAAAVVAARPIGPSSPSTAVTVTAVAGAATAVVTAAPTAAELSVATGTGARVAAAAAATGAFALDLFSFDAAFVTTLAPGAYTVQLSRAPLAAQAGVVTATGTLGSSGSTVITPARPAQVTAGVALLEIYEVP